MQLFILILLICGVVLFIYFALRKNFKVIQFSAVGLVTGAPKTGKSLVCVYHAIKSYKSRHRRWWFITKILKKQCEEPLFYTNTSLSFGSLKRKKPHRLDKNIRSVTLASLLRDERFAYGSVIYINEASLFADNMDVRDINRNIDLSLFNKLIGHETKGGLIYYDTQNILDCHYSIKRVCSNFWFLQKSINCFLFRVVYVREMINTDIGNNNFVDDIDTTTRKIIIPRWYYHKYDRYEFSYLTDNLPISNEINGWKRGLVSFNPKYIERSMKGVNKNENN